MMRLRGMDASLSPCARTVGGPIAPDLLLIEQLNYNLLYRWFVGLEKDDAVRDATVFSKDREPLRFRYRPPVVV